MYQLKSVFLAVTIELLSAGFVSFASPDDAQSTIKMMNGFQLDGKKLKVQLKRENKQNKAY